MNERIEELDPSREQKRIAYNRHFDRSALAEEVVSKVDRVLWADGTPWTQNDVLYLLIRDALGVEQILEKESKLHHKPDKAA